MKSILLTILFSFAITAHAEELYHPADTNQDWKLTSQEFEAYNTAWRKKQSWPAGPVPIQMGPKRGRL